MNKANAVVRTYSWGPEAQGVPGTLRMISDSNGVYFPAYDPNGNVMGLVKASDGTVCAQYEYLPYGEQVTATGTMTGSNPIRFSTKYYDTEARLYYYGYRYYSSDMGRWLSRDPIEEQGGLNLYGFVNNDPVNKWDKLGMSYVCSKYEVWKGEYKKFTKSEKIWFIKHLCCAFSARNSKENIIKEVVRRYSGGPENTVVNAIQHCAWMCYVASMFLCSKDDALALGRAHEDWGDNPEHDMAMDLFNNAVGVS
ncbi:MAG: RHS repeat-associated core domain-containing protein, partial [Verrucomicrobia bacterium]|nr:RHS repeat-associated core domain-containing protein [Verrucomicrobiota bacterium]